MQNKMIGILICTLLIATVFPVTGAMNIQNALKRVTNDSVPDLACKGEIVKKVVKSGLTVTGSFKVENIGKPGSLLNWEVATWPDFGTNWSLDPSSGENLTPEYGPMTVSVTFKAPIVEDNMYYGGVITIWAVDNHNDYDLITVNINVANHSAINTPFIHPVESINWTTHIGFIRGYFKSATWEGDRCVIISNGQTTQIPLTFVTPFRSHQLNYDEQIQLVNPRFYLFLNNFVIGFNKIFLPKATISMHIIYQNDSENKVTWIVDSIEGDSIWESNMIADLYDQSGQNWDVDYGSGPYRNEYLSVGDQFFVTTTTDGYFRIVLNDDVTGNLLYGSPLIKF